MSSRSLGRLMNFSKSTVIGGVFVLMPLVLLAVVIGKALTLAYALILPVTEWLPVKSVGSVSIAFIAGIGVVLLGCFLAGLLARTAVSKWFVESLERHILAFVPSYGLLKSMGQGWVGVKAEDVHKSVLVRLDDSTQIGFVMDVLSDSRHVVFIPSVPTPWSGSLMIVAADRIEHIPASAQQTIDCLRKLGVNASKLLARGPGGITP